MQARAHNADSTIGRLVSLLLVSILILTSSTLQVVHGASYDALERSASYVQIGVLGLFHSQEFVVRAIEGRALILRSKEQSIVLENSGIESATIRCKGSELEISVGTRILRTTTIHIASRENEAVDFLLEIPGKITRHYRGLLELKPISNELSAVVTMDLETAVASVLAAESAPDTPLEAMKAYAIAARSYFGSGRGRHRGFDFCDTTHCQFLRMPPPAESNAARAVAGTRGLVLVYQGQPFAPLYTRSCSGRTRTPPQSGNTAAKYPYFSVECSRCRLHPAHWTSRISARDAASVRPGDETLRLAIDRKLGWSAVPSNDFSVQKEGDSFLLKGVGNGHGIGLCQTGAKDMAEQGANYRQILDHYYPNTNVVIYSR